MDRKSLIILLVSFLVLVTWIPLTNKIFPPKPAPIRPTNIVSNAGKQLGTNRVESQISALTNRLEGAAPSTNLPPREERTATVETDDARYIFSSIGGGLKLIELKHFPAAVDCAARRAQTNP